MPFDNDLHDWYVDGVMLRDRSLSLHVHFYEKNMIIKLSGVSRCSINEFLVQNIISEAKIVSADYFPEIFEKQARQLDEIYPRKWAEPIGTQILTIEASVGAAIVVEFTDLEIFDGP